MSEVTMTLQEHDDLRNTIKELTEALEEQKEIVKSKKPIILLEKVSVRVDHKLVYYYKYISEEEHLDILNDQAKLINIAVDAIKEHHKDELESCRAMVGGCNRQLRELDAYSRFKSDIFDKIDSSRKSMMMRLNFDTKDKKIYSDNISEILKAQDIIRIAFNDLDKYINDTISQFKTKW